MNQKRKIQIMVLLRKVRFSHLKNIRRTETERGYSEQAQLSALSM
jgi:hypothetical protein